MIAREKLTEEEEQSVLNLIAQVTAAMGEILKASLIDPLQEVHSEAPFLDEENSAPWAKLMRDRVFLQMCRNRGSGQRFDRAMAKLDIKKMAETLFIFRHFNFVPHPDGLTPFHPSDMDGYAILTDEACSVVLSHLLNGDLDVNFVRHLRRKYSIEKLDKRFLISRVKGPDGRLLSGK